MNMKNRCSWRRATTLMLAAVGVIFSTPAAMSQQATGQQATPRTADGKPDLSGVWTGTGYSGTSNALDKAGNIKVENTPRPCHPNQECTAALQGNRDTAIGGRGRGDANVPLYKPQFWEKVQDLDDNGNEHDLAGKCFPLGVPRMGAPDKIIQTGKEVIFLYANDNTFRVIPIDGRAHHPVRSQDLTYFGDAVGQWDGDTLVIDVVGFNEEGWLGWPGWFHSRNMRVVERLRREGTTLIWQATVHDPDVLMEPWVMDELRSNLNKDPQALLQEDLPCDERDFAHMETRERG